MTSRSSIRRLSSSILTPVYKLGFPVILLACGIELTYQHLKDEPFHLSIVEVLLWILILLVAYLCLRLKKVTAYSDHLVVSNYATHAHVRYHDIEEIKGRVNGALVAFVRLRLRVPCRYGRSVHFLLRSTGGWIESRPEFQLLEEKCPHLQVRVRSWWQVSVREHHC